MAAIPLPAPPLRDASLALRPFHHGDAGAIVAACQDPEIPRWTAVPSPYGDQDARDYLSRAELDRRRGHELGLAVVDAASGALLGAVGLRPDPEHRKGELGYWIAAGARRRGVGARAVRLLALWALRDLGLERLEILVNPANLASQRLAERAGFTREGLLRSYRVRKGERED